MRALGLGKGPHDWRGVKTHMGINQEAYDAVCAAIVSALDLAAERQRRWRRLGRVTDAIPSRQATLHNLSTYVGTRTCPEDLDQS